MYFLPFSGKTRFTAFNDTPEVEKELTTWLSGSKTWDQLENNEFLKSNQVDGTSVLGIFFKKDKTFVTNDSGLPQIRFKDNPRSLLFIFSNYSVSTSSGSFSYDRIKVEYFRYEISAHFYNGETENLQGVWEGISRLQQDKVNKTYISDIENTIKSLNSNVNKLSKRNDPLTVIMPALASEAGQRHAITQDILKQLNNLQAPLVSGVANVTNYPTKDQFYHELSKKTDKGYVDGVVDTKASHSEFLNHIHDQGLHHPTYIQVGSPSRAEYQSLVDRVGATEDRVTNIEVLNPVTSLSEAGGLLVTHDGAGNWLIDASGIGIGTGDKPQEQAFYFGGILKITIGEGGQWSAWEAAQLIGVKANVTVPSQGSPIIVDIKKNGVSMYGSSINYPFIPANEKNVLFPLPSDVMIAQDDEITVDIIDVGATVPGTDLTIQIRYEYVT